MAITYQYGTPSMYAQAAQMIGESERIKTEQNIALQQQEAKAREKLFERQNQLSIEGEMRAREWDLQKMTLVSQNNFAMQERKNQILAERDLVKEIKRQDELEAGLKTIMESEALSDKIKPIEALKYKMKKLYNYSILDGKEDDLAGILRKLDIDAEKIAQMKEQGIAEQPKPQGLISKILGFEKGQPSELKGEMETPFGGVVQRDIPPVVQKLQLTETDKARLNQLDAVSKREFESIFNSNNPELIKIALSRLRNL